MMGPESEDESSPQAAIDMQPSFVISHGCTALGQQSWSPSDIDISAGVDVRAAALATGSNATDSAIRRADMVRAIAMAMN